MTSWSLVGRADELAFIRKALHAGAAGLALTGDPGVGKTELARAATADASAAGQATHLIGATSALSEVPYGAVAHLIPANETITEQSAVLATIIGSLGDVSQHRLFLVVDDANLLDSGSSELVAQLVGDPRTFALVSLQSGETIPPPIERALGSETMTRLELQPLDRKDSDTLVAKLLRGPLDPSVPERLWDTAHGNPLLVRELVVDAREDGELEEREGTWVWVDQPPSSVGLDDVLQARLARSDADERAVLELLAVGEPTEHGAAASIASQETVDTLSARGLLIISQTRDRQLLRLAHPTYGDLLRQQLDPERRRELCAHLADCIQAAGARRSDDPLRLVSFRLDAGGQVEPALFLRAAHQASSLFDEELAERLTRSADDASAPQ
jgi:hypothetical protein